MIPRFCQRPDRALGSFVADLDTRSPSATGHRPGGAGGDGRRLTLALLAGGLPIATRCVGHPADQGRQGFQVLLSDSPPDGVGPGVLLRGQCRDCSSSPGRQNEQVLTASTRIGLPARPFLGDDVVGHPLHALPGQAYPACDLGDRQRLIQDSAKHLPPGRGQLMRGRDRRGRLEEFPVERENGKNQGCEGVSLRRSARHWSLPSVLRSPSRRRPGTASPTSRPLSRVAVR